MLCVRLQPISAKNRGGVLGGELFVRSMKFVQLESRGGVFNLDGLLAFEVHLVAVNKQGDRVLRFSAVIITHAYANLSHAILVSDFPIFVNVFALGAEHDLSFLLWLKALYSNGDFFIQFLARVRVLEINCDVFGSCR